jgi:hypothetical protein
MNRYLVSDLYEDSSMAIDWTMIPEDFLSEVSKDLYNVSSVTPMGDVVERTVVFIKPVDEFPEDVVITEFCNIILGREQEIFDDDEEV